MATNPLVDDTEQHLRQLAAGLTEPYPAECLLCYVYRMLEYGCTGPRWIRHYRDLRAPRATALERRLGQAGGYCDCEVFLNAFEPAPEHWIPEKEYEEEDGTIYVEDATYPDPMPPCRGVRLGSTRGCELWVRQWRRRW